MLFTYTFFADVYSWSLLNLCLCLDECLDEVESAVSQARPYARDLVGVTTAHVAWDQRRRA